MRGDLSEHCLCDNCSGYDCGSDEETLNENKGNPLLKYSNKELIEELKRRGINDLSVL
jgi:hypothetical protein